MKLTSYQGRQVLSQSLQRERAELRKAGKGGPDPDVLSQEGNLDGEGSGAGRHS